MTAGTDILIIDDDQDLVRTMQIVLKSADYDVRAAYDGQTGYAQIEEKIPDLIVLDVMMTTATEGFDLAYKLKNNPAYNSIPILMVTSFPAKMAQDGPENFQHILGQDWPVSKFLEKPIEPDVLLETVAMLLKQD